ncbi:MAG: acetylglutamate kinase [Melioribacteraceae bacterium]|nr:acetylglutamate kinase [Melioribacteraceae bacterium]MCF8355066.1 acetylglutamate kinase [Melioribacteraceae bacterium]MCF8395659.1 acetylglutamate kinase [Melioribacteraceae bacterium]MCF8420284.1 acetylglutamate kinase [Melioribacteraceae bacterium]
MLKDKNIEKIVVIKYGGNAMQEENLTVQLIENIVKLHNDGYKVVIVHGGGPFIKNQLELAGIKSEFIGGHRKTDSKSMKHIEMALKGEVNGMLVREINNLGARAVGLSGKDGALAVSNKRYHTDENNKSIDLGQVGDIHNISPEIIYLLLENNFIPVVASIATGEDGIDYNINADMFAGHLAGAIKADEFIMLTDVDGLLENPPDESSLINELPINKIEELKGSVITGGMIPKTEACKIAVELGTGKARILNGTKPDLLIDAVENNNSAAGTKIF